MKKWFCRVNCNLSNYRKKFDKIKNSRDSNKCHPNSSWNYCQLSNKVTWWEWGNFSGFFIPAKNLISSLTKKSLLYLTWRKERLIWKSAWCCRCALVGWGLLPGSTAWFNFFPFTASLPYFFPALLSFQAQLSQQSFTWRKTIETNISYND